MAELTEGQQIIFRHPANGRIRAGSYSMEWVSYCVSGLPTAVPFAEISEWCDASEAWNALTSQKVRAGNFEWNEGPTVEPETI